MERVLPAVPGLPSQRSLPLRLCPVLTQASPTCQPAYGVPTRAAKRDAPRHATPPSRRRAVERGRGAVVDGIGHGTDGREASGRRGGVDLLLLGSIHPFLGSAGRRDARGYGGRRLPPARTVRPGGWQQPLHCMARGREMQGPRRTARKSGSGSGSGQGDEPGVRTYVRVGRSWRGVDRYSPRRLTVTDGEREASSKAPQEAAGPRPVVLFNRG